MKSFPTFLVLSASLLVSSIAQEKPAIPEKGTFLHPTAESEAPTHPAHLFILSGQSNMAFLNPATTFAPAIHKHFGENSTIIVKHGQPSQGISRWYKNWEHKSVKTPENRGDLYDHLMKLVKGAIKDREILSVTFLWMQGERDARPFYHEVYQQSLEGLIEQFRADLGRDDLNVVIGRLSDAKVEGKGSEEWIAVREIQVGLAESNPSYAWVDTDDLNNIPNKKTNKIENNVHYGREGYDKFGTRLAETAIKLIEEKK